MREERAGEREREEGMGGDSGRERGRERVGRHFTNNAHTCIIYCTCHHTVNSPDSLKVFLLL